MTFLDPVAFAWLGLAAPIVALYFLKMRRRRVQVASTWLWRKSINDLRVNAPFQRLRKSLLLLLQLLLVILGALALARPSGKAAPPEHKRWAILIDRSASMRMKDVAPSRLEKAKALALQAVKEGGPDDEFMVVAFSSRAQILSPMTGDRGAVERAIESVEPTDAPTRIQEAYRLAASALEGAKLREIVLLSDGGVEPIQGAEDIPLRYVPVGAKPRNAAVTALDVRRPSKGDDPWTVFAQIDLFHDKAAEVPVELRVNGELKGVKKVKVPAEGSVGELFEVTRPVPDVVEVRIAWEDDLEADDRAWQVVTRETSKILLAGPGDLFLRSAVAQVKDAEAFRVEDVSKAALGDYQAAVIHGAVPDTLPEGRYLIFGAVPKWEGVEIGAAVERPVVVDWSRRHAVTRNLDLSETAIKSAPRLKLPGYATSLADAPETPLIFAWEKGRTRAVVVAFEPSESDWPWRLSFPLFVSNAREWLRWDEKATPRPGEPLRVRLPEGQTKAEVAPPGGGSRTVEGPAGGEAVFGETERVGVYTMKTSAGTTGIALNLFDPHESRGAVAPEIRLGKERVARAGAVSSPATPYWRWFAAGVLLLLIAEWMVYHRRWEL